MRPSGKTGHRNADRFRKVMFLKNQWFIKQELNMKFHSETLYYYDDEIIPTVYTDYVRSLEDNEFQCND